MLGIIFRVIPIIGLMFIIGVFIFEAQKSGNEKHWGDFFLCVFEIVCNVFVLYEWIKILGWT